MIYTEQELQDIFNDENTSWETKQTLKNQLPKIDAKKLDTSRKWKKGDILLDGISKHFLVI